MRAAAFRSQSRNTSSSNSSPNSNGSSRSSRSSSIRNSSGSVPHSSTRQSGGIFWVPHRRGFPGGFLKKACASPSRAQGASQPGADVPTALLSLGHVCVHVCVCFLSVHSVAIFASSLYAVRSTVAAPPPLFSGPVTFWPVHCELESDARLGSSRDTPRCSSACGADPCPRCFSHWGRRHCPPMCLLQILVV